MRERLQRRSDRLAEQVRQAASEAAAMGASWPAAAPSAAELATSLTALEAALLATSQAKATWQTLAAKERSQVAATLGLMRRVDEATDFLFGPGGAEKEKFGVRPKRSLPIPPLAKLTRMQAGDGLLPASISLRWGAIVGCVYEVQWSLSPDFAEILGSLLSTRAKCQIEGLVPRQQIWMRVRPARGSKHGPWSDPETRVAPL